MPLKLVTVLPLTHQFLVIQISIIALSKLLLSYTSWITSLNPKRE
jgi:hypothetical protein